MFLDLLTILIEKPEKQWKFGIFIIKVILNLIFTSTVYTWIFGSYDIINLLDYQSWYGFIISGRVLICILLFFVSQIILFSLLSMISTQPLHWAASKIEIKQLSRTDEYIIKWILKKAKFFNIDKNGKTFLPAKNTEQFHDFVLLFKNKQHRAELSSLKASLLNDILHTYFVFVLEYYFLLDIPKSTILNIIIIIGLVLLPLGYLGVHFVFEFMSKSANEFSMHIDRFKLEKNLYKELGKVGIYLFDVENPEEMGYKKYFNFNSKKYFIKIQYTRSINEELDVKACLTNNLNKNEGLFIIANNDLTTRAKALVNENNDKLIFIYFKSKKALKKELIDIIKK